MSDLLHQIMYISTARPELTESALFELLHESRERNATYGITGLLLHSDGNIIQIIEGKRKDVETLFHKKIKSDPRHGGIILLSSKTIQKRDFPEYRMGFRRENKAALDKKLPGFSEIVESGTLSPSHLEGLSKIVATFLKTFALSVGLRNKHSAPLQYEYASDR